MFSSNNIGGDSCTFSFLEDAPLAFHPHFRHRVGCDELGSFPPLNVNEEKTTTRSFPPYESMEKVQKVRKLREERKKKKKEEKTGPRRY